MSYTAVLNADIEIDAHAVAVFVPFFVCIFGEDGYIKVYDDETDILLETFDKSNVNKYTSSSPYRYDMPVKRIRIETSATTNDTCIYIYHVKELDDEALVESYTQEEFENLQYIKRNGTKYYTDGTGVFL